MNHKFTRREFVKLSSGAAVSIVPKRAAGATRLAGKERRE